MSDKGAPAMIEAVDDRSLALVLSGGGGRGGAHLGVLKVIEELRVPLDLCVGTSIGGIIGVLYAAGHSVDTIADALDHKTLWDLFGHDPSGLALIGNRRMRSLLDDLLGARSFADLAIPCAVVAVDLVAGRETILDQGPLVDALLATASLPGLFPPVARGAALLADGGILNNLPIDVALRFGATKVIAVNLGTIDDHFAPLPFGDPHWHWRDPGPHVPLVIAQRALGLLIAHLTDLRLAATPPDLLLEPAVARIGALDMGQITAGRTAGEVAARAARDQLNALREWRASGTVGLGPLDSEIARP